MQEIRHLHTHKHVHHHKQLAIQQRPQVKRTCVLRARSNVTSLIAMPHKSSMSNASSCRDLWQNPAMRSSTNSCGFQATVISKVMCVKCVHSSLCFSGMWLCTYRQQENFATCAHALPCNSIILSQLSPAVSILLTTVTPSPSSMQAPDCPWATLKCMQSTPPFLDSGENEMSEGLQILWYWRVGLVVVLLFRCRWDRTHEDGSVSTR